MTSRAIIKGLAITTPCLGRISTGHIVESGKGDQKKRRPQKDDHITVTTQRQLNGQWEDHPLQAKLIKRANECSEEKGETITQLRSIPVRLPYNNPELNLRANYSAFNYHGRPVCVGDGETAQRYIPIKNRTEKVACPGYELCDFGNQAEHRCKLMGRALFQIEGQGDDFGAFIHRTSSYNTVRTLAARLQRYYGLLGSATRFLPLTLRMMAKSSRQSMGTEFYYLDLVMRTGTTFEQGANEAMEKAKVWKTLGVNLESYEAEAINGLMCGAFEDSSEEALEVDEFLADETGELLGGPPQTQVDQETGQSKLEAPQPQSGLAGFQQRARKQNEREHDSPVAANSELSGPLSKIANG